jgi:hypothetical protein
MILPSYDPAANTVDPGSPDCAGRPILTSPELAEAEGQRSGLQVNADAQTVSRGPDGFQVVWLRSHEFADGTAAGPLSLIRPKDDYAEVYAIGLYRGSPETSRFGYERLGPDILITAANEACAKNAAGKDCDSEMVLYLSREGSLKAAAKFPLERIYSGPAPGISGSVQYRLTSTPRYGEKSVQVVEQLVLRDSGQNEIRRAKLDRTWKLDAKGDMVSNAESLWGQVMGEPSAKQTEPPEEAPQPETTKPAPAPAAPQAAPPPPPPPPPPSWQ